MRPPRSSHAPTLALLLVGGALTALGCSPDFAPYNEVHGLRVLAVRADQPHLPPGGSAALDLLIHTEPDDPTPVEYTWSWCPFSSGGSDGYACATDRDSLQALLDENAPGLVEVPPFELGDEATATLAYPLPPFVLQAACQQFLMQEVPDFLQLPDCTTGFPIVIKVTVRQGSQTITAVKELKLLFDEQTTPNRNPSLEAASIFESKAGPSAAMMLGAEPVALRRGVLHRWQVEIDPTQAERFVPDDGEADAEPIAESLAITWFVQGGETEYRRTGYIEDFTTFEQATQNAWTTPTTKEFDGESMSIYMVIRDNRGGVGWLSHTISLE